MFSKASVNLGQPLHERARAAAGKAGYSSVEEFVKHAVEKELARIEEAETKEAVTRQLRGLGYLE
jgi:Arc/MetJ-type ribon-helix-helix transcriptional regulator